MKIIVSSQKEKEELLRASSYLHGNGRVDTNLMGVNALAHIYRNPDCVVIDPSNSGEDKFEQLKFVLNSQLVSLNRMTFANTFFDTRMVFSAVGLEDYFEFREKLFAKEIDSWSKAHPNDRLVVGVFASKTRGVLPYHHRRHTHNMVLNCVEGWFKCNPGKDLDTHTRNLGLTSLMLGALYHDAEHSLGFTSDAENIERAIKVLDGVNDHVRYKTQPEVLDFAKALIHGTKWPHTPLDITDVMDPVARFAVELTHIIRDADMMAGYVTRKGALEKIFVGLFLELKLKNPSMTVEEFIVGQKNFHQKVVNWNTKWAKVKAVKHEWVSKSDAVAQALRGSDVLKGLARREIITL